MYMQNVCVSMQYAYVYMQYVYVHMQYVYVNMLYVLMYMQYVCVCMQYVYLYMQTVYVYFYFYVYVRMHVTGPPWTQTQSLSIIDENNFKLEQVLIDSKAYISGKQVNDFHNKDKNARALTPEDGLPRGRTACLNSRSTTLQKREAVSYLRLIDFFITQLWARESSRREEKGPQEP